MIYQLRLSNNINFENKWGYTKGMSPFIDYIVEDKSKYPALKDFINPMTGKNWVDRDNDFKMGDSGGILMNIDFVFIGTEIFSRVADFYDKHGVYTLAEKDSPEWREFWARERRRRIQGVIAKCKLMIKDIPAYLSAKTDEDRKALLKPLRITGDHYNYLNYGRIDRFPSDKEIKEFEKQGIYKVKTIAGFPRFWDGDYWNFKLDELISDNSYNLCKAKARRKGFSYKRGSQAANTMNLYKNVTVTLVADNLTYLTDKDATSYMAKVNLDWFENHTDWKRGYLSEDFNKGIELGYRKKSKGMMAFGFRSKLLSIPIGKNESAAVGKKSLETDFEEAGKCPNLQRALDVMKSNSESGAIKIGTIRVYGTGGVKEANWEVFRDCFYIPSKNDMLPMENIWDNKARHTVCGFFFPQIWDCEPFVEDGNSLLFDAWADDKRLKDKARENQKGIEYAVFIGQRANSPSDAFVNTSENMFHSAELIAYISDLQNDESLHFHKDGWYVMENGMIRFIEKPDCIKENIFGNNKFHDFITDVPHNNKTDVHGCIREFYAPIPNEGDLYFISCDPYRVDKNIKEVTDKHSLFSFQVWMRTNKRVPYSKILVASYCGRLNTMEDNDRLLLYACLRWNAKVLIEAGTGETVSNFKKWGYRNLLLKDPTAFLGIDLNEKSAAIYGVVIGDGDKKLEGLRMLKDYLYEVISINENGVPIYGFTRIKDLSFLYELERFNATGNFDRISSAIVGMYEFKKDSYNLEKSIKTVNQKPKGSLAKMLMGDLN